MTDRTHIFSWLCIQVESDELHAHFSCIFSPTTAMIQKAMKTYRKYSEGVKEV